MHANTQLLNEVTEALDVVSGHREGLRLEADDKLYPSKTEHLLCSTASQSSLTALALQHNWLTFTSGLSASDGQ